jgi:hypothetical protein
VLGRIFAGMTDGIEEKADIAAAPAEKRRDQAHRLR